MSTLADLRHAAGLTQEELARRSGVSWSQIQKLEYLKSRPTWETLQRLAKVLGVEVFQAEFDTTKTGRAGRKPRSGGAGEHQDVR